MVKRIRNDRVFGAEQGLEQPCVGVEAAWEQNRVLGSQKLAQTSFQPLVRVLGPADETHRRHAEPIAIQCVFCRFDHRRVIGQSQVVVGTKVYADDTGFKQYLGLLRRDYDLFLLVEAVCLK